jgi:hypothetical protein
LDCEHALAGDAKSFAAGHENVQARGRTKQRLRKRDACLEQVLAVVQHEQCTAIGKVSYQCLFDRLVRLLAHVKGGCHGQCDTAWFRDGRQVDETNVAVEGRQQQLGEADRKASLATAADASQRQQPDTLEDLCAFGEGVFAANEPCQRARQVLPWCRGHRGSTRSVPFELQDEPVATARNGNDRVLAEDLAQGRDLHLQVVLLDDELRPNTGQQLILADEFTRALDQRHQQLERSRAHGHGLALDE